MALNPLDRLVRDVDNLKKQGAGRSQLNHSSLENTAIPVYDGDGQERLRIGAQDDGTHAVVYVQGPPPPRPTAPIVSVDGPVVRVRWDGQLMGGHIPEDFARIDVHFALASDDLEDPSAVRANLATAAGSEATLMATTTGTYRVGLVAMSQSRARSEMSDTVEVVVQVVDLATAIETATQSANGKNTVVYSERSPEPTDEGSVGDTWFVNEIRPRDPEDPASGVVIAIIEQWQHTGGEWVQVEMAHEVIASVDLGRATVGYLHGERIEAGTIDTPQLAFGAATGDILAVDALNFKRAVGLDIRGSSFRAGEAVEITEDFGIRQFGPDGALNVSLPSDGSEAQFRGDLSARTLTATGRMSIQGPGAIASGGVLELESGVVPPVAGPQITNTWDRTTFPPLADSERPSGIAWAEGHWWRAVSVTGASSGNDIRARVEKLTPTGELVSSFPTAFGSGFSGLTLHEGLLYTLGAVVGGTVGNRWVVAYNLDGTESHRWEDTEYGATGFREGVGTDGTSIIRAQCSEAGYLYLNYYNPTTGAQTSSVDMGDRFRADVAGVYVGSADFGTKQAVVAKKVTSEDGGYRQFPVFNTTAPYAYKADLSWYSADFQQPAGMAWDGQKFHSLTPSGDLVSYQSRETNRIIGDDADDWWGAVTWATGSQETTAGPATRFRYLHRAQLRVQNGDVPAGVEAARFYTSKGTAEPARTDLQLRVTSEQPHEPLKITSISSFSGGTNPPATNTFTTDVPGEIHSAIGNFRVDGSGAGEWGPLEFHEDGSMSDSSRRIASGQISVDATANVTMFTTVTFPVGRFTREPILLITPRTDALSQTPLVGSRNVTAESAQIAFRRSNAATTLVNWLAIEQEG